jgi:hypothetical protein
MNLADLAVIHLLVGGGCAAAHIIGGRGRRPVDALLLVLFWPLYGPLILLAAKEAEPAHDGRPAASPATAFREALAKAAGTPLSVFLPGPAAAEALAGRLAGASERVAEIDALLTQPDLSEETARLRHETLLARGEARAAAAAAGRLENIRQLRALRERFAAELEEVHEMLLRLRIQAEVARLAGGSDRGTRELIEEVLGRIQGLDAILEDTLEVR